MFTFATVKPYVHLNVYDVWKASHMSSFDSKLVFVAYVIDIITIMKIKAREVEILNILESGKIATYKLDI